MIACCYSETRDEREGINRKMKINKKVVINNSTIKEDKDQIVLEYVINLENGSGEVVDYNIRFGFEPKYAKYICDEIADGVVVILLPYALRGGYDIESKIPVTEELLYRLQYQLVPQLAMSADLPVIRIISETIKPNWHPYAVATAMSCGVDSFASFFEYSDNNMLSDYKITHLTFFQNGAHHSGYVGHSDNEQKVFDAQLRHVKKYCDENGRKLIVIKSNVDEVLSKLFWEDSYDRTHTYRNTGIVLMLQKLIKIYYYSPGYNVDEFQCNLEDDSALYERLILPNVSTNLTCFYNSSGSMTRIEKIDYISSRSETYNSLLVCYASGENCGSCYKCRRTLLELYFSGNLNKYAGSFQIDDFLNNKNEHIVWLLQKRRRDHMLKQIETYIKEKNIRIPLYYYIIADLRAAASFVIRKILR